MSKGSRQNVLHAASGVERPVQNEDDEEDLQLNANDTDSDVETEDVQRSLKEQSPFTDFFNDKLSDTESIDDTNINSANGSFSPMTFDVIKSHMHVYPLWGAAMLGNLLRHCNERSLDQSNDVT